MQAFVTVTNEQYLEGTKVLMHSFLKENPVFQGDLVVIHNELPNSLKKELSALFPIKFRPVSTSLISAIKALVDGLPTYGNRYQRFWSLETFNLEEYDEVLFMDSDILCRGDLSTLLQLEASFAASADVGAHEGSGRNITTFEKAPYGRSENTQVLKSFNAGVMFFKPSKLGGQTFNKLLSLITPEVFEKVTSGHTDQYVLNRHFHKDAFEIGPQYNYLIQKRAAVESNSQTSPDEALVWHFIRHPKPWKLKKLIKRRLSRHEEMPYWKEWHKTYRAVLTREIRKSPTVGRVGKLLTSLLFT